jgi:hypothetical protein
MAFLIFLSCGLFQPLAATELAVSPTVPLPPSETPTPQPVMITASEAVQCTSGPGEGYILISTIEPGTAMELVGTDASGNYWIVIDRESRKGCWVESRITSTQGQTGDLPILIPPPTLAAKPAAPENLSIRYLCTTKGKGQNQVTLYLEWEDKSNTETGYEIHRYRDLLKIIEADSTSFADSFGVGIGVPSAGSVTYVIIAFNEHGKSLKLQGEIYYNCKITY